MAKGPQTGDQAPDFELPGTDGPFQLSAHRGERVVLLFYPGDDTPVCTKQFCSYRDQNNEFSWLGATVVGISAQSVDSHKRFIAKYRLTIPLLADTDHAVAKSYGVHRPIVGTQRAAFIVDEQGVVRYKHLHTLGLGYRTADDLREALEQIAAPA